MRKTTRTTWLLQLLSFSFLFHAACSVNGTIPVSKNSDNVPLATVAQNAVATATTTPISAAESSSKPTLPLGNVGPPTDAGKKDIPTQTAMPPQPATVATTLTVTGPKTSKPTVTLVPTKAPVAPGLVTAGPATNLTGADPTTVKDTTTPRTMSSQPHTILPATRSGTRGPLVVATNAAAVEPLVTIAPDKTSRTKAPVITPSGNINVGTTLNVKVPTDAPSTSQRSMVDTTVTAKPGRDGSQGGSGTDKTTLTDRSREQTASGATQSTGNMGPTNSPSTPAKTGPSTTVGTFTAKAGSKLPTSTPKPLSAHTIPSTATATATTTTTIPPVTSRIFSYSLNSGQETEEEKELAAVCQRLLANYEDGNCTLKCRHRNGKIQFDSVEINGKVKTSLATEYYEDITKKPADNKTLIAILASCGALLIMIVILAVCASHHRKPYSENQQHLTEELHTVENGYHDNPTLEVMEVQPEMQEKKMTMNGEFNDSWIVPIDNLLKEDIPDEEDTHL